MMIARTTRYDLHPVKPNAFCRLLAGWLYLTMLILCPCHADEALFKADDVLKGVAPGDCQVPSYIRVALDGRDDCLRFYGTQAGPTDRPPLVFLVGDVISVAQPRTDPPVWQVGGFYKRLNPRLMQKEAEHPPRPLRVLMGSRGLIPRTGLPPRPCRASGSRVSARSTRLTATAEDHTAWSSPAPPTHTGHDRLGDGRLGRRA